MSSIIVTHEDPPKKVIGDFKDGDIISFIYESIEHIAVVGFSGIMVSLQGKTWEDYPANKSTPARLFQGTIKIKQDLPES